MKKQILLLLSLALSKTYSAQSPLFKAIKQNNIDLVTQLLAAGADVNAVNHMGYTPLHTAISCTNRYTQIPALLIQHGADVNAKSNHGVTPLLIVALYGSFKDIKIAQLLLDHGANINTRDNDGETPLCLAADSDDAKHLKLFLERGAHVNSDGPLFLGETALHRAAKNPNIEMTKALLDRGADIHAQDDNGNTPLYSGLQPQEPGDNDDENIEIPENDTFIEIMRLLLEKGACTNQKNKLGNTALHIAAFSGKIKAAHFLLTYKSNTPASKRPC